MKWFTLFLVISSLPAWSQTGVKNFVDGFTKGAAENIPGEDALVCNFTFTDDGAPTTKMSVTPKRIIPVNNLAKLPLETQQKLKINPKDGRQYYFLNYLEEASLTDGAGKEFKGPASVTRMMRKNPVNNEIEFLYGKGEWHKVLSSNAEMKDLTGLAPQDVIDKRLRPLADAGIRPIELTALLKDPEIVCKWVGTPKPVKVSLGKYAKKYFCRSQVQCASEFILGGNDMGEGSYDVSCANDKEDCSGVVSCMEYEEDEEFQQLKKTIPATSTQKQ